MQFNVVDIIVLVIMLGMAIQGWRAGGIVTAGNIVSVIVSFALTTYLFAWFSTMHVFANWQIAHPILTVIAYVIVFLLIIKLLRLAVALINQLYRIIALLPLLGPLNRLIGAVIGVVQGAVVVVVIAYLLKNVLFVAESLPVSVSDAIAASTAFHLSTLLLERIQFLIPQLHTLV